ARRGVVAAPGTPRGRAALGQALALTHRPIGSLQICTFRANQMHLNRLISRQNAAMQRANRGLSPPAVLLLAGIEDVADGVAEEVPAEDEQEDRGAGDEDGVPVGERIAR